MCTEFHCWVMWNSIHTLTCTHLSLQIKNDSLLNRLNYVKSSRLRCWNVKTIRLLLGFPLDTNNSILHAVQYAQTIQCYTKYRISIRWRFSAVIGIIWISRLFSIHLSSFFHPPSTNFVCYMLVYCIYSLSCVSFCVILKLKWLLFQSFGWMFWYHFERNIRQCKWMCVYSNAKQFRIRKIWWFFSHLLFISILN